MKWRWRISELSSLDDASTRSMMSLRRFLAPLHCTAAKPAMDVASHKSGPDPAEITSPAVIDDRPNVRFGPQPAMRSGPSAVILRPLGQRGYQDRLHGRHPSANGSLQGREPSPAGLTETATSRRGLARKPPSTPQLAHAEQRQPVRCPWPFCPPCCLTGRAASSNETSRCLASSHKAPRTHCKL